MFIKQKFPPDGNIDKLEAKLVADGSQQGRHLYDFVSSAIVSLQGCIYAVQHCILPQMYTFDS